LAWRRFLLKYVQEVEPQIMEEFRQAYLKRQGVDAAMFVTRAAAGPRVMSLS
jgi:hypothetical protein